MPVYEYSCSKGCNNYEVWRRIDERQSDTNCPVCAAEGARVFTPVMSLTGSFRLKQEQSEPRLVRKEVTSPSRKPRLKESGTRPWMLNRGC
jgi:putative FmdB family regulatory protein